MVRHKLVDYRGITIVLSQDDNGCSGRLQVDRSPSFFHPSSEIVLLGYIKQYIDAEVLHMKFTPGQGSRILDNDVVVDMSFRDLVDTNHDD